MLRHCIILCHFIYVKRIKGICVILYDLAVGIAADLKADVAADLEAGLADFQQAIIAFTLIISFGVVRYVKIRLYQKSCS